MKSSTCRSLKLIVSLSPLTLFFLGITSLDANHLESSRRPHPPFTPHSLSVARSRPPTTTSLWVGGRRRAEGRFVPRKLPRVRSAGPYRSPDFRTLCGRLQKRCFAWKAVARY